MKKKSLYYVVKDLYFLCDLSCSVFIPELGKKINKKLGQVGAFFLATLHVLCHSLSVQSFLLPVM